MATNFKFHTSLLKVRVTNQQAYAVIFSPTPLEEMNGGVYGFRNGSAKQFGVDIANTMAENLVTVYQLVGPEGSQWPDSRFEKILKIQLPELEWWPFGNNYEVVTNVTTPYFNHFSEAGLETGLPWELHSLNF